MGKMIKNIGQVFLALVFSLAAWQAPVQAQVKQPNIVLILMDNLGYGVYGGGILRGAPSPLLR